jgi:DHA1 family tetracycline resistance protein-like MFS transporter
VLAGIGASQAVVEGVLLSSVTARLGERRTALLGYAAGALGYAVLALALAGWTIGPAVVLLALGGLAVPSVRAMVSARGDVDTQGEMQGVLTAVEGLTAAVAPLLTAGVLLRRR